MRLYSRKTLLYIGFAVLAVLGIYALAPRFAPAPVSKPKEHLVQVPQPVNTQLVANRTEKFQKLYCKYTLPVTGRPRICIYNPKSDLYVSGAIAAGHLWDPTGVNTVLHHISIFDKESPVTFLDLGANIGAFTIPVSSQGVATVSVEPLDSALVRVATSIQLNNLTSKVTLIQAALTERAGQCLKTVVVNEVNKGGTEVEQVSCGPSHSRGRRVVESVTLENLMLHLPGHRSTVVVKMDIQRYEPFAILGGRRLFREQDVRMLYLEWAEMKAAIREQKDEAYVLKVDQAMAFLLNDIGMEVHDHETGKKLKWENRREWSNNIFLVKPDNWYGFGS